MKFVWLVLFFCVPVFCIAEERPLWFKTFLQHERLLYLKQLENEGRIDRPTIIYEVNPEMPLWTMELEWLKEQADKGTINRPTVVVPGTDTTHYGIGIEINTHAPIPWVK